MGVYFCLFTLLSGEEGIEFKSRKGEKEESTYALPDMPTIFIKKN
jgi:hypothetical protein